MCERLTYVAEVALRRRRCRWQQCRRWVLVHRYAAIAARICRQIRQYIRPMTATGLWSPRDIIWLATYSYINHLTPTHTWYSREWLLRRSLSRTRIRFFVCSVQTCYSRTKGRRKLKFGLQISYDNCNPQCHLEVKRPKVKVIRLHKAHIKIRHNCHLQICLKYCSR